MQRRFTAFRNQIQNLFRPTFKVPPPHLSLQIFTQFGAILAYVIIKPFQVPRAEFIYFQAKFFIKYRRDWLSSQRIKSHL